MLVEEAQTIALGNHLYQQVLQQSKISREPNAVRLVQKVGARIAAATNKPDYSWEFTVIEDSTMSNAWVLPGGKVGVCTGIFPIAYDEAGLAVILGHEAAHAIARHPGERMSQDLLLQFGAAGLSAALGGADPATTRLAAQAFGLGANFGVILPFSRVQESEADHIGLILTAKAGYDPRAALEVWERMERAKRERPHPPEFLSTIRVTTRGATTCSAGCRRPCDILGMDEWENLNASRLHEQWRCSQQGRGAPRLSFAVDRICS